MRLIRTALALLLGPISCTTAQTASTSALRREILAAHNQVRSRAGVLIGAAGAFALTRVMAGLLFDVSPTDPLVFAAVAALLTTVAAAASWLPARRAAALDPLHALREE